MTFHVKWRHCIALYTVSEKCPNLRCVLDQAVAVETLFVHAPLPANAAHEADGPVCVLIMPAATESLYCLILQFPYLGANPMFRSTHQYNKTNISLTNTLFILITALFSVVRCHLIVSRNSTELANYEAIIVT